MDPIKIKVIVGSTREGRVSDRPARWIAEEAKKMEGVDVEILDLRDYPLPFFNEAQSPSMITEPYANPAVQKWTQKIAEGDAFIIVTPEYNHGYPAVLKNAIDYVNKEWNRKPVGFISHGSAMGSRAVEQLRQVAVELQMAPIRHAIQMSWDQRMAFAQAPMPVPAEVFAPLAGAKDAFLDQLMWWAKALKAARQTT